MEKLWGALEKRSRSFSYLGQTDSQPLALTLVLAWSFGGSLTRRGKLLPGIEANRELQNGKVPMFPYSRAVPTF
jgi:hypothetical protein